MQKLLGFYRRQLSTYSRCQTLYRSEYTEKNNCCKSRGGMPHFAKSLSPNPNSPKTCVVYLFSEKGNADDVKLN